jgi:hypothetical protein
MILEHTEQEKTFLHLLMPIHNIDTEKIFKEIICHLRNDFTPLNLDLIEFCKYIDDHTEIFEGYPTSRIYFLDLGFEGAVCLYYTTSGREISLTPNRVLSVYYGENGSTDLASKIREIITKYQK